MSTSDSIGGNMQTLVQGQNSPIPLDTLQVSISTGKSADVVSFRTYENGKTKEDDDFIFYGQRSNLDNTVTCDIQDGETKTIFSIDLPRMKSDVSKIAFCITSNFPKLDELQFIKIEISQTTNLLLDCNVNLTNKDELALILGEIYKHNGAWKFRFVAQGFNGGLKPLAEFYGVNIADDEDSKAENSQESSLSNNLEDTEQVSTSSVQEEQAIPNQPDFTPLSQEELTNTNQTDSMSNLDGEIMSNIPTEKELVNGTPFEIITKLYKEVFKKDAYLAPDIPEKKMNGGISGIANNEVEIEDVLLIYDSTLFGACDTGILLSKKAFYYRALAGEFKTITYADIVDVNYERKVTTNDKGKESVHESLVIVGSNSTITFSESTINYPICVNLLKSIKNAVENADTDCDVQITRKPLEEMPFKIKQAYIQLVINLLLSENNEISTNDESEVYSLIARLKFTVEERFILTNYADTPRNSEEILREMLQNLDDIVKSELSNSLMKDLIYIFRKSKNIKNYTSCQFILKFADILNINNEKLEYINKAIDNDEKIFDDDSDDASLQAGYNELIKTAGSVGVPIAALYLSGSVVGLSATGITSGLASLGFGGVLGFSSMATGIGALLIIGFGTKKGLDYLTGSEEVEKRKRKEMLLLEVNKHLQHTLNLASEDINYISMQLSEAFSVNNAIQADLQSKNEKIHKLIEKLTKLTRSNAHIAHEREDTELKAIRQRVPTYLDVNKLATLTNEPTKKKFYQAIVNLYELQDDDKYKLRQNITLDEMINLDKALHALKYFEVSALAKQGAEKGANLAREGFSKLTSSRLFGKK